MATFTSRKALVVKRDRRGRRYCRDSGRPVPCPPDVEKEGTRAVTSQDAVREARRLLSELVDENSPHDPQFLGRINQQRLMDLTLGEIRQLAREFGLSLGGKTKDQAVFRILWDARLSTIGRERWKRKARAAGFKPRDLFGLARQLRNYHREYNQQVVDMIRQTRALYRSETGTNLTRNHPAFRGGDPASIEGFDRIARTLAGRYPALLGVHGYGQSGDSTQAARRLYDFLLSGTPKAPTKDQIYEQALGMLLDADPEEVAGLTWGDIPE